MNLIKPISLSTLLPFLGASVSTAFAPLRTFQPGLHQGTTNNSVKRTLIPHLPKSNLLSPNSSVLTPPQQKSTSKLNGVASDFVSALENIPEGTDLVAGAFIIFCAVTPYFLGLFFPEKFDASFFMKTYGDKNEEGRAAENNWKKMYATLGLTLTSIQFYAYLGQISIEDALRLDYIAWTLFYIAASIKLAVENRRNLIAYNYIPSQLWHLVVACGLTADLLISPKAVEIVSQTLA